MAATVITVEFGTIHHFFSLEQNSEIEFVCAVIWTNTKLY